MKSIVALSAGLLAAFALTFSLVAQDADTSHIRVHPMVQIVSSSGSLGGPTGILPVQYKAAYGFNRITNQGQETVQLLTRHWIITDAFDHVEEVKGPGVVGEQPVLAPGESFKYSSWCPLKTPTGIMHGTYQMIRAGGDQFDIEIAPFALRAPYTVN